MLLKIENTQKNILELFKKYNKEYLGLKYNYLSDIENTPTEELIHGIKIIEHFLYKLPTLNKVLFSYVKGNYVFRLKEFNKKQLFICSLPSIKLAAEIFDIDSEQIYDKYCDINIFLSRNYYFYSVSLFNEEKNSWINKESDLIPIVGEISKLKTDAVKVFYKNLPEILFALKY